MQKQYCGRFQRGAGNQLVRTAGIGGESAASSGGLNGTGRALAIALVAFVAVLEARAASFAQRLSPAQTSVEAGFSQVLSARFFDRGDSPGQAHKARHDGRVVAGTRTDVDGVLAFPQIRLRKQIGVERGLAIVDVPLRHDADEVVGIDVHGIGAWSFHVAAPRHVVNGPGSGPQKILTGHFGKGALEPRVGNLRGGQDSMCVGASRLVGPVVIHGFAQNATPSWTQPLAVIEAMSDKSVM